MNESNNQAKSVFIAVNSVNSTQGNSINSSGSDLLNEQMPTIQTTFREGSYIPLNVPMLPAENQKCIELPAFSNESNELTPLCNDGAAGDVVSGMSRLDTSQRLELVTLIQTLHSANSNLLNRANQMEEALTECQKSLQSHKKQLYSTESTLTQQSQELATAQEQVRCLLQELKACHQKVQHQQILTESLTAQLQSSQERVAQLERECSFAQADYNQQSQQLMQTEDACRELRARLIRQQSYTLQLKLALEKSLDVSVLSHQAQPIQPWPAQPQSLSDELELNDNSSLSPLLPSPELIDNSQAIQWEESGSERRFLRSAQLSQRELRTCQESSEAEEAHLQSLVDMFEDEDQSVSTNSSNATNVVSSPATSSPPTQNSTPQGVTYNHTRPLPPEFNWPSPVVYPTRPPKGRRSLAAIELPTFAPNTELS